jgi:hypothetical protein
LPTCQILSPSWQVANLPHSLKSIGNLCPAIGRYGRLSYKTGSTPLPCSALDIERKVLWGKYFEQTKSFYSPLGTGIAFCRTGFCLFTKPQASRWVHPGASYRGKFQTMRRNEPGGSLFECDIK